MISTCDYLFSEQHISNHNLHLVYVINKNSTSIVKMYRTQDQMSDVVSRKLKLLTLWCDVAYVFRSRMAPCPHVHTAYITAMWCTMPHDWYMLHAIFHIKYEYVFLCFVLLELYHHRGFMWIISHILHSCNHMIVPVPMKQPKRIWVKTINIMYKIFGM